LFMAPFPGELSIDGAAGRGNTPGVECACPQRRGQLSRRWGNLSQLARSVPDIQTSCGESSLGHLGDLWQSRGGRLSPDWNGSTMSSSNIPDSAKIPGRFRSNRHCYSHPLGFPVC
jgi:hypothetical protein